MPFSLSGAALRHLTREFRESLLDSRLENIYQPDPAFFLLRFKSVDRERQQLLLPLGGLPHISQGTITTPATPSQAAQIMRKHLRSGRVTDIGQPGLDRIMWLDIQRQEETRRLVVELFGRGNLMLVQDGLLLWVLKPRDYRHRSLRVGRPYLLPPQGMDPCDLERSELTDHLSQGEGSLERRLARDLNLGPQLTREVLARSGMDPEHPSGDLNHEEAKTVVKMIMELLDTARSRPHLYLEDERPVAAYPWVSRLHRELEFRTLPGLSEAYEQLHRARQDQVAEEAPDPELERWERRVEQQCRAIENYRRMSARFRSDAEALYANYTVVQRMLEVLSLTVEQKGWEALAAKIDELPGLVAVDPEHKEVEVKLHDHSIILELEATVDANANRLYARSKRAMDKARGAREAQTRTIRPEPKAKTTPVAGNDRTFWFERFRWFITSTGNVVVGGRDARSNETVVRRYLKNNDVYCHADLTGAPSVVVKHDQGSVDPAAAHEGCLYSLAYSKAWPTRVASGHTYWTEAEQVSKTPQTGEFLAKGSFVIRGRRHWHRNQPVEAAVGWVDVEGTPKMMGGPVPALEARSVRYVVLRPGYLSRRETAQVLAAAFDVDQNILERVLPPGDCDLVRTTGIEVDWPSPK